jgi:uncharacterized protein (DUF3084 family)
MVRVAVLYLFFISLVTQAQIDSTFLIKKSRIKFCLEQTAKVNILSEQILVKDSIIKLTEERISIKDSTLISKNKDIEAYKLQLSNLNTTISLLDKDKQYLKNKYIVYRNKSYKRGAIIIGLVAVDLAGLFLLLR